MRHFFLIAILSLVCGCVSSPSKSMRHYLVLDAGVQPFKPLQEEPYRWLSGEGRLVNKGLADEQGRAFVEPFENETIYMIDLMWGRFRIHVAPECWKLDSSVFSRCADLVEKIEGCSQFECTSPGANNTR